MSVQRLTDDQIEHIVEDDTNNCYVYGWKEGTKVEEVMPMATVLDRVERCAAKGDGALSDPELLDFRKTHPRIFEAAISGDKKRLRLVRAMIETRARCEASPEVEEEAMTSLHLQWMGFGRKDRRKMLRNLEKAKAKVRHGK